MLRTTLLLVLALTCTPARAAELCHWFLEKPFSEWPTERLVQQSKTNADYVFSLKTEYTDLLINNRTVVRGLPKDRNIVRRLGDDEVQKTIFRHYSTLEAINTILQQKRIVTGPTAYVSSPWIFNDLTGIFFTTPEFKQEAVGLSTKEHSTWVDVLLPEQTAVIKLEEGIYLVAGQTPQPTWLIESLKKPATSGSSSTFSQAALQQREAMGLSAMVIPIQIISNRALK